MAKDASVSPGSADDRARLQAMLSISPVAVAFLDRALRYSRITPALAELHGSSIEEARDRTLLDLFAPEDVARVRQVLQEVIASRAPVSGFEITSARDPEKPRHLVCCFFPVALAGELVGIGAILVDDTERRRLDRVARLRALELEAVLASIPEGIYVGDTTGVHTANRAALAMLGFESPDQLNRPVDVLMSELDVRTPEGRPQRPEDNVFVRALAGEAAREEFLLRPLGAKEHIVVRSSAAPLRTEEGIVGAVAVNVDVTERRRLEAELRTQRELAVIERDVLLLLSEGAPLQEVLGALALGLERTCGSGLLASVMSIENETVRSVVGPSLPRAWCESIEGEATGPQAGSCGTAAFRKARVVVTDIDTDPLWDRYRERARVFGLRACWSQPICATDGAVLGTVALYYREPRAPTETELDAIDKTARVARVVLERHRDEILRNKLLDELHQTVRMNETLIGIVGHDLRNPLQAIAIGAATAAKIADDEQRGKVLERVQSSAARMGRMIGQILDLTRARLTGGIALSRAPIKLAQVATTVADEVALAYPDRTLSVAITGDTSGELDAVRMSQVFTNLVCNAMQHGAPSSAVELRVAGESDAIVISVRNDGVIPEDHLPWLFDPFRRGKVKGAASQGLGLGLFISKEIVTAHGGQISVSSTARDGTRFEIRLPRTPRPPSPPPSNA